MLYFKIPLEWNTESFEVRLFLYAFIEMNVFFFFFFFFWGGGVGGGF